MLHCVEGLRVWVGKACSDSAFNLIRLIEKAVVKEPREEAAQPEAFGTMRANIA